MPRGNDSKAALDELADKFGKGVGNAEELIEASLAQRSELLRRAELLPVDPEATRELDINKLKGPDGEKVVSAKVRGGITVVVYEDARGGYRLAALDEKGKPSTRQVLPAVHDDFPSSADRPPLTSEQAKAAGFDVNEPPPTPAADSEKETQSPNDDAQTDGAKGKGRSHRKGPREDAPPGDNGEQSGSDDQGDGSDAAA